MKYVYQVTMREAYGAVYFSSMKKARDYILNGEGNYRAVCFDSYMRCYESKEYNRSVMEIRKELVK